MKKSAKTFLRSFRITLIILVCTLTFVIGISMAYQNIRLIGFGEYRNAVEIENGRLKIFAFEIDL